MTDNGIENPNLEVADKALNRQTIITLLNMKEAYRQWCNQDPEDIAFKIIEHCFPFFLDQNVPRIKLIDGSNAFYINDRFSLFTKGRVVNKEFPLENRKFNVVYVHSYSDRLDNKIHYCADTREVLTEKLSFYIPELDNWLTDASGKRYSVGVFVTGDYLDENVSEDRTEINFDKKDLNNPELDLDEKITREDIAKEVVKIVEGQLKGEIETLSDSRFEKIQKFIQERPRYKKLLKYKRDDLKRIQSGLSIEKLEVELFKIEQKLELEVKEETDQAIKEIEEGTSTKEFREKHPELYAKIIDVGASKLSEYIIHRKVVLDLFESHLKKTTDGKFVREDVIHDLIFPLRKFSDDVDYDKHNLWMIDERLSYHKYLASDIPLKDIDVVESESRDRPDLLILNNSFAFNDSDKPYSSIVLVEFKRPMRKDYSDDENPIITNLN